MSITKTKDYQFDPARGYLGSNPTKDTYKYMQIGDRVEEVRELVVYEFNLGDVEDPDLYAADPLWKWQESEIGKWIMTNAVETPAWYRIPDPMQYGYKYQVRAKLTGPRLTEYLLRHPQK
jgi:hypothetical protein